MIEGFHAKNRKLAVAFVCGILKESNQSRVFSPRNPWIHSLLQILREIQESAAPNPSYEIESLFTLLKASAPQVFIELKPHGILQNFELDPVIRKELEFILKKPRIILPSPTAPV